jgi:hypothetical protein
MKRSTEPAAGAAPKPNIRQRALYAAGRLAWAAWWLALAQVVLGLVLAWMNRLPLERLVAEYVLAQALATIAFATVGLIIAARRPEHTIGWLFCAAGIGLARQPGSASTPAMRW